MVDHNLQSLKFCDRAIVLHNGSVIEFTKVEEAISAHLKLMKNKRVKKCLGLLIKS